MNSHNDCDPATDEEIQQIADLRNRLEPELSSMTENGTDFPHMVGDIFFLRVVRGNSGDLEKATVWYRACLELRKEFGLDEVCRQIQEGQMKFKLGEMPNSEEMSKYYNTLFDEDTLRGPSGHLVWIDFLSDMKPDQMLQELGWDKAFHFFEYLLETRAVTIDRLSREQDGRLMKTTRIIECEGVTWAQINHKEFRKKYKAFIDKMLTVGTIEMIHRLFIIGCPWFFATVLNAMQRAWPERVRARLRILGTDYLQNTEFINEVGLEMVQHLLEQKRCGSDDDGLEGMFHTVSPGSAFERHVKVKAGQTVSWEFSVGVPDYKASKKGFMSGLMGEAQMLPTDLMFSAVLIWEDETAADDSEGVLKQIELATPEPADNRSGDVIGCAAAPQDGVLVVRWSNLHSWVSPKMLAKYKVELDADGEGSPEEADWGL